LIFHPSHLPGVFIIKPRVFGDGRGFFTETYRKSIFAERGITCDFIQDNHSMSSRGILRGLHYQIPPAAQTKLIRVLTGEIFDVAVDIRKGSKTFGMWHGEILSGENQKMMVIPEGFAHGFLCLRDQTHVIYKVSAYYSPAQERGILWNDPVLKIDWPDAGSDPVLAERDADYPVLDKADIF